jgi:4-amino-4-deoxy-L-arabinose transferase-like glycosyltransferase
MLTALQRTPMTTTSGAADTNQALTPLRWVVAAFVGLCLVYLAATPPLEASDELWHFGMVQHIATTGQLPVQTPGVTTAWQQEGSQPPLYYLIGALIALPFDRSDFDAVRAPNPHVKAGVPGDTDNKNLVLRDAYPVAPQGTALAVYAVRLFSTACAAVTIVAVYRTARLLAPKSPQVAAAAAGMTAFNPMFVFISASVNNDNLVTALNALLIWQMLDMLAQGRVTMRRGLPLALLFACASLTKLSALALAPFLGFAIFWVCCQRRAWGELARLALLIAVVWAVVAGWWYLRNLALYGELLGTTTMVAVAGAREMPFSAQTLFDEYEGFRISYWGLFGAVNILAPQPFYWVMDGITVLSLIGLAAGFVWASAQERLEQSWLGGIILTGFVAVAAWTAQTYASQGRLLFPFIAASSPIMALGLWTLLRRAGELVVLGMAAAALMLPFFVIAPAYAPPAPMTAITPTTRPVFAQFDDIRLIGYQAELRRYVPGDTIAITLYWQPQAASARDLSLYLHVVDSAGNVLGRVDTYPGGGRLRTTTWGACMIYPDSYQVRLEIAPAEPTRLRMQVGWWHPPTQDGVAAVDASGAALSSVMLDIGAVYRAPTLPSDAEPVNAVLFGDTFALTGYQLTGDRLTLIWQARTASVDEYVVFAQVVDEGGHLVGQGDAPPAMPTQFMQPGDTFVTTHDLHYPQQPAPGTHTLIVGWYRPSDFARLPLPFPDNAYPLLTIDLP